MKKILFLLICAGMVSVSQGKTTGLRAYMSHAAFYTPEYGPYLETYLSILGSSVTYVKNANGKFQGTVNVTILFKQNDSIRQFRKYDLNTTEVTDTAHLDYIVFDQQRISLPSGKYDLILELADRNSQAKPFKARDEVTVNFEASKPAISDIELIDTYKKAGETSAMAKSGYDFIPYQDYFYPQGVKNLRFYAEIYHADALFGAEQAFVVATSVNAAETGKPIDQFFRIKTEKASSVNVVFNEFDISQLPSGNYTLMISVRDRENKEVLSRSMFIQRSNPGITYNTEQLAGVNIASSFVSGYMSVDTLREFIRMCGPIATGNEKLFINFSTTTTDLITLQRFFLEFWTQRSPADPAGAWQNYYQQVLAVQQEFGSTNKKGYETDRGRVYLQYGPPNDRMKETMNPDSYPYEIWHYYQIGTQSNMRFVFYTRDLALNDYRILHSTVIGEVKNVSWQYDLKRSSHDMSPRDTDNSLYTSPYEESNFGEHTGEYYNLKR
jgi:GWxTD domain-containing protein